MKLRHLFVARLSFPLASAIAALLVAQSASAATYYWDSNGATTGYGTATGTWAAPTVSRWGTNDSGSAVPGASITTLNTNGTTDALNSGSFKSGLGAGTITVSGTVNSGNMTFDALSGAIGFSGGTISFWASPVIAVNNVSATFSSVLAGAGTSLTKTGIGTLALNGTTSNTFTGGLNLNAGALALDFANMTTPTDLLASGKALTFGGANMTILG